MWISSWPISPQEFLQRDHWHADLFLICIAIMRLQIRFAVLALILFSYWWATGSSPPRDWAIDCHYKFLQEIGMLIYSWPIAMRLHISCTKSACWNYLFPFLYHLSTHTVSGAAWWKPVGHSHGSLSLLCVMEKVTGLTRCEQLS
jgi:hypothetical protein